MNGCHNCQNKPLPGTRYEDSLCATCPTMHDPRMDNSFTTELRNVEGRLVVEPEVYQSECEESESDRIFQAFCSALSALLEIAEKNSTTLKVLLLKLKKPEMSYSEIAELIGCKKQNISYHLRSVLKICPEMKTALLIDNRYSRGYSIKRNV